MHVIQIPEAGAGHNVVQTDFLENLIGRPGHIDHRLHIAFPSPVVNWLVVRLPLPHVAPAFPVQISKPILKLIQVPGRVVSIGWIAFWRRTGPARDSMPADEAIDIGSLVLTGHPTEIRHVTIGQHVEVLSIADFEIVPSLEPPMPLYANSVHHFVWRTTHDAKR